MKNFFERHFKRIMFVILTAIVTTMAVLSNHMENSGYGNFFAPSSYRHSTYHDNDNYRRTRSERQPWKVQKPSSNHSSKSSQSSGRK